jgi:hypothetical protein
MGGKTSKTSSKNGIPKICRRMNRKKAGLSPSPGSSKMNTQDERYRKHIKMAFFWMKFLKWFGVISVLGVCGFSFVLALFVTHSEGLAFLAAFLGIFGGMITLFCLAMFFCYCPNCGQHWWSFFSFLGFGMYSLAAHFESGGDETETYKCRRCKLELGPYLRK